ncbi:hypothetical protein LguiB_030359 [Lonicera macranthoides]
MMRESERGRMKSGEYLGEISALCFLHPPPPFLPFLLAGTGSQIILYNLVTGKMISSFQVFQGIRVHGISSTIIDFDSTQPPSSSSSFKVAVFGERRVKLFSLHIDSHSNNQLQVCVDLIPFHSLPKFSHWVLDVRFLKDRVTSSHDGNHCLVIGCSDNTVYFWDILHSIINFEVSCPDRCLLYSMRMWGDQVEALHIASGTIYNEIIVWKVICPVKDCLKPANSFDVDLQHQFQQHEAFHVCRLSGHEGSIFRIAWSSNGSKLLSASDDRCARIWSVNTEREGFDNPTQEVVSHSVGPVLFGHSARVWDCCIFDFLIITVGEDCTCRVWGLDGIQLKMIKEHVGRGVWRCLYDPNSSLLVTAGFDSAIKVHQLDVCLSEGSDRSIEVVEGIDKKEIFTLCIPNSSGHVGLMDSKSEYVRCLQFIREDTFYVATNNGYLFHAKLCDTGEVIWTELVRVNEDAPIVCMNLLSTWPSDLSYCIEDWVAVGDGKGSMTVVSILADAGTPKMGLTYSWSAEKERQLLGTFWCKSLGYRFIFTADPRGTLKLWRLCSHSESVAHISMRSCNATLLAEFVSCFGIRLMCLDALLEEEVLVCGDLRGNLVLFPLLRGLFLGTFISSEAKIDPLSYFKGGHGISCVCSVSIATSSSNQVEIHSTGGDGCICYLEYDKDQRCLEFIGMKQVKELSLIRSALSDTNFYGELVTGKYAIGFASADFIIWNLITEMKVVQIPCGGWRRPHSYYLGDVPEKKNCFAFVKDEIIYIHRHWVPDSKSEIYPLNLHLQFHGREMHSLCFISEDLRAGSTENKFPCIEPSWIATGCEDGTVRLTRYDPGVENWSASKLLGEHVGGSAVRSICSVSKMHIIAAADMPDGIDRKKTTTLVDGENPFLLISVGAKRVLTAWQQKTRWITSNKKEEEEEEPDDGKGHPSLGALSSISFQWLSTDMPTRNCSTRKKGRNVQKTAENCCNENSDSAVSPKSNKNMDSKSSIPGDEYENDWRYLAVTAFLVKVADSRISVCFIVVACSDATVALRALVLPYRLWFDVALFVPLASPVLALQHVIIPEHLLSEDNYPMGGLYIVISGSTDGSIALWDLSENVSTFMWRVSALQFNDCIDGQKRPRTGRGSQGGRWWRSLYSSSVSNKKAGDSSSTLEKKTDDEPSGTSSNSSSHVERSAANCSEVADPAFLESERKTHDDLLLEICRIWPLHVLNNVHQSGVNCLHVSDIKGSRDSASGFLFYVISGGDDQALHSLRINLALLPLSQHSVKTTTGVHGVAKSESLKSSIHFSRKRNYHIKLCHDNIISAHSSAVKGVWTDGHWVFSTGLDQRVRCWSLEELGKLTERAHLIVSVPEPEALDARACTGNHYQIAVAGCGMQIVEFFAPGAMENGELGGS